MKTASTMLHHPQICLTSYYVQKGNFYVIIIQPLSLGFFDAFSIAFILCSAITEMMVLMLIESSIMWQMTCHITGVDNFGDLCKVVTFPFFSL